MSHLKQMLRTTALAATVAMSSATAQAASVWEDYSSFWVLGDSLSDTGNLANATGGAVPGPAYFNNRFSNGPIWADYISRRFFRTCSLKPAFTARLALVAEARARWLPSGLEAMTLAILLEPEPPPLPQVLRRQRSSIRPSASWIRQRIF